MEIFNTEFVNAALNCLQKATQNGGGITREKFCVAVGLPDTFMPVVNYMLEIGDFREYELVRKAGIRRKVPTVKPGECVGLEPAQLAACVETSSTPMVDVLEPVTTPDPEPAPEAISAPSERVEPEAEPAINLESEKELATAKPVLRLTGTEGDSIALMAKASKCAARNGLVWDDILATLENTDYDYIAAALENHFDVRSA